MVRDHPAKFGDYRRCGRGDKMNLMVEGKGFTSPDFNLPLLLSLKHMACHADTQDISGRRHKN